MQTRAETDREPIPEEDLAAWVKRHQRGTWRYLRFLGCDASQLDDLLQEALIAAIAHGMPSRPNPVAAAWLRTTARNLHLAELRVSRNRAAVVELSDQAAIDAAWNRFTATDRIGDESIRLLSTCLRRVQARARECLDRFYRDGESRDEIADALGIAVEGVKTLLRRTKDELRRCIENERRITQ